MTASSMSSIFIDIRECLSEGTLPSAPDCKILTFLCRGAPARVSAVSISGPAVQQMQRTGFNHSPGNFRCIEQPVMVIFHKNIMGHRMIPGPLYLDDLSIHHSPLFNLLRQGRSFSGKDFVVAGLITRTSVIRYKRFHILPEISEKINRRSLTFLLSDFRLYYYLP